MRRSRRNKAARHLRPISRRPIRRSIWISSMERHESWTGELPFPIRSASADRTRRLFSVRNAHSLRTQPGDLMSTVSALRVDQASLTTREELFEIVFDGNYESVHQDVRELLFDPIFAHRSNLTLSQAGRLSYERSRALHRKLEKPLDILRNPLRLYALAEWCGLLDVSCFSLVMVHYNLSVGTVYDHGQDRDDIADYVDEMNSLASFSPYMATELGYGNNLAALRTEAVYDHASQTFVLNTPDPLAQKFMSYSGFGDIPKIAVVMARLKVDGADYGVFPFLVRLSTEQGLCEGIRAVSCPEKPVQGLDNGLTWFDHVRIPARNILLGDVAEITAEGKFK